MANHEDEKQPKPENLQVQIETLKQSEKFADLRLDALEESVKEIRGSHLEGHKWFVTIFFGLVGAFLAYTANQSKTDVREDLRDMRTQLQQTAADLETKVNQAISNMNQNFAKLAGEAVKKPLIEISNNNGPLEGQVLTNNGAVPLFPIFLKNAGEKNTGRISLRLCSTVSLQFMSGFDWQDEPSNEKEYPYYYRFRGDADPRIYNGISAQDAAVISYYNPSILGAGYTTNGLIYCKLQAFYDAEKPAEARFQIKFR